MIRCLNVREDGVVGKVWEGWKDEKFELGFEEWVDI